MSIIDTTTAPSAIDLIVQKLASASLDDNPISASDDPKDQAFAPALVDFLHASADFLLAAKTADMLPEALGNIDGLSIAVDTATLLDGVQ